MRRVAIVLSLFVIAFTVSAGITTDPPAPTTRSFVMLHVSNAWITRSCNPEWWTIERSDRTFDVRFTSEICIPEQVGGWSFEIPLGRLDPGVYNVRLSHNGVLERTYTFVVTLADAPVNVPAPYASTRGGTRVFLAERDGCASGFPGAVVLIDGSEVPTEAAGCGIFAIAPAHAPGPVDVEVRTVGGQTLRAPFALRYLDPAAPVDPAVFERVLIPILYNGPGAFGSQWVTDAKLEAGSAAPWFHDFERAACNGPCSTPPALSDFRDHATGIIVTVPRQQKNLFSLRIRDVSRSGMSAGTEVPIAREKDFRSFELVFADVPFDAHHRLMLRLYSMTGVEQYFLVTAGTAIEVAHLTGPCAVAPCASVHPSFAAVDLNALFTSLAGQGPRRVSVDTHLEPLWGFITVTNNVTQQVTVISPMR